MNIPGLTLVFNKLCESFCIGDASVTQVRISTDPTVDIVEGFPVPGDPDLSGRKVEV